MDEGVRQFVGWDVFVVLISVCTGWKQSRAEVVGKWKVQV